MATERSRVCSRRSRRGAATPFFRKYVSGAAELQTPEGVTASPPLGRNAVRLTLAELLQTEDKYEDAIEMVEQLEPDHVCGRVARRAYVAVGRYTDVVELTDGVENTDDATALLCVFRGVALREQGFQDAALEAFRQALRSRSRDTSIRHLAVRTRSQLRRTRQEGHGPERPRANPCRGLHLRGSPGADRGP